jgi:threonine/homoserine/homoserine lactone efflux protein
LVIQRTLRHGRAVGMATGLGAAVADAAYGALGAFGVTALVSTLQQLRLPLALLGGVFLLWLAWRTWHAIPPDQGPSRTWVGACVFVRRQPAADPIDPATILSFVAIFGALGASGPLGESTSPWAMVGGVPAGSALWWLLLCAVVGALRQRFDARAQRLVGKASALMFGRFRALAVGAAGLGARVAGRVRQPPDCLLLVAR